MGKYFKDEQTKKISLSEYYLKTEVEYQEILDELEKLQTKDSKTKEELSLIHKLDKKKKDLALPYRRIKHIYSSLGDVEISGEMIDTLGETFESSKCRYGTICQKPETVQAIYEISELFPELSQEAILSISREYIKDLFDKYSLVESLSMMLRIDGKEDTTFEKFIGKVQKYAEQEDKIYDDVASRIRMFCGQYTYDFVRHFEKFVKKHHISWSKFCEGLPSPEIILKDQIELKEVISRSKDCWAICEPITFQMLESYLDGDTELSKYEEQPAYYISTYGGKIPTSYTKTEFLESIQKRQEKKKRKTFK